MRRASYGSGGGRACSQNEALLIARPADCGRAGRGSQAEDQGSARNWTVIRRSDIDGGPRR